MSKKVEYKDLSWPLKTAVVAAWILGGLYLLVFIGGMITGLY